MPWFPYVKFFKRMLSQWVEYFDVSLSGPHAEEGVNQIALFLFNIHKIKKIYGEIGDLCNRILIILGYEHLDFMKCMD